MGNAPSQALPRQLPQGGSQAVRLVAKVLGITRKCPAVLLALPLGELSPQVTERAHAVCPVAKASGAMANFPAVPKGVPLVGAGECSETEGVKKHPRRHKPAGVSVCYYVPCTPKGTVTQASIS